MPNTNFQTILQMPGIVNDIVKQATGRNSVSQIDMDFVTVAQDKQTVLHEIDYTAVASFVNNNQLPLTVRVKITPVQSGTGVPSPDNIRPITGWTKAEISHSGADTSNPETLIITFPTEAGTVYGGTLDVTTGVLTVDSVATVYDGSSDEGWSSRTTASGWTLFETTLADANVPQSSVQRGLCNRFSWRITLDANLAYRIISTILTIRYDGLSLADWATYLSENVLQILYPLATPITYQLTPTEIKSLVGENNLYADTGDISVSYTSYIPVP